MQPVTVRCQECRVGLAANSPELRLMLTYDDAPVVYCAECWAREFSEEPGIVWLPPGHLDSCGGSD